MTDAPRPVDWTGVVGNGRAVQQLREAVEAAVKQGQPVSHTLLYGPPGTGKTTLAKILAKAIGGAFVDTSGAALTSPLDLIKVLWRMNHAYDTTGKPSVLFLDEIHTFGRGRGFSQESLYFLLEDGRFPHNMDGKVVPSAGFEGATSSKIRFTAPAMEAAPFTCVGATTEPGMLLPAMRRRFPVQIELEPYSEAEVAQIILGMARHLDWAITPEAATALAQVSRLSPGEAYKMLTNARNAAVATAPLGDDTWTITPATVALVVQRAGLFPRGLTKSDVRVLRLLARRARGMGQAELCAAAGVGANQYRGLMEPYLQQLGFTEITSRRQLTDAGRAYLAALETH